MAETMNYAVTHQGIRDLDTSSSSKGVNVGPEERAASTIGGAVLAGLGLGSGGVVGLLLTAAGGAMAYRGVTGHCSAYAAAGINTAR